MSRLTTWFFRFMIEEYGDDQWSFMFRMIKASVYKKQNIYLSFLTNYGLLYKKQNTRYCLAIPIVISVVCTLLKLAHDANMWICSKLFAIGSSTVLSVVHDICRAINIGLCHEIVWPTGTLLLLVQNDFKLTCGLWAVLGTIDGTHISISKT